LSHVIRNGVPGTIPTIEIVPGDLVIAEEGTTVNADGTIVYSHDFSVNESSLTGEAHTVFKSSDSESNSVFSGTLVSSGLAVYQVERTGKQTKIGQLGTSLLTIREEPTPLQTHIGIFVRRMAILGVLVFLLVWAVNFAESKNLLASLLKGLTLAMSILPEEIPVAFTTFMALGSRRLMKNGVIVKKTSTVETLGGATVICADKTGTITQNRMSLYGVYAHSQQLLYTDKSQYDKAAIAVIETAMWASEPIPFDPMEKTLHSIYENTTANDRRQDFSMIHEYPLSGKPPMMTHVFENKTGDRIIAAKGAPEAILPICNLSTEEMRDIQQRMDLLALEGFRMLGVAQAIHHAADFPLDQRDFSFQFMGLVIFYDPPKEGIDHVFEQFYDAGIDVKIITGDNLTTTSAIAKKAGVEILMQRSMARN
jgi:Ca2+-transporting ATPase